MNRKCILVRKVNELKYEIFTDSLFNIHFIFLLYSIISIPKLQKHFSVLNSQIVV